MEFKTVLAAGVSAAAVLSAGTAQADNYYMSVFGGWSSPDATVGAGPTSLTDANYFFSQNSRTFVNVVFGAPDTNYNQMRMYNVTWYATRTSTQQFRTAVGSVTEDADNGFVVGAALGMDFQDGWRAELELAYRSYDLGERHQVAVAQYFTYFGQFYATLTGTAFLFTGIAKSPASILADKIVVYTTNNPLIFDTRNTTRYSDSFSATLLTDGDISAFSLMANLWYDFDLGDEVPLTPFVGAGAGVAQIEATYRGTAALPLNTQNLPYWTTYSASPQTASFSYNADEYVFAWQAAAGLSYEFANGMSLSAQYRYFSTGDVDLGSRTVSIDAHEAIIGLSIPLGGM